VFAARAKSLSKSKRRASGLVFSREREQEGESAAIQHTHTRTPGSRSSVSVISTQLHSISIRLSRCAANNHAQTALGLYSQRAAGPGGKNFHKISLSPSNQIIANACFFINERGGSERALCQSATAIALGLENFY
jgi:hypothetical protein